MDATDQPTCCASLVGYCAVKSVPWRCLVPDQRRSGSASNPRAPTALRGVRLSRGPVRFRGEAGTAWSESNRRWGLDQARQGRRSEGAGVRAWSSRSRHVRETPAWCGSRSATSVRPSRVGFVYKSEPDHKGASMTPPTTTVPTRELQIEFLFLDLDTCTRCRATDATLLGAIERTRPALEAAGVAVRLTKTLVANEALARALGFVSSPTIRINGVDIAGELVESACDTCSEACACDGGVACRDWIYRGERSTEPPLGLIVEAIMRHAVGADPGSPHPPRPEPREVPENLRQYFAAALADTPASDCCPPDVQADCCEPEHKAACCGNGAAAPACGCHVGP